MSISPVFRQNARPSRVSKDVRTLLSGTAVVAIMLLAGKGIPRFLASRRSTESQLRAARTELAADREIVLQRSGIAKSLDETTTRFLGISPAFLKGGSASQAAAQLASVVTDAAEANGVHLSSLQPGVDSTTTRTLIEPVVVHASGMGDVRGISGMLRDLESGAPIVVIRQLTIAQSDPAATSDRMEALHLDLSVRALYRRVPGDSDDRAEQ